MDNVHREASVRGGGGKISIRKKESKAISKN